MVIGPDVTRELTPDRYDEADALLRAAFGQADEAELVKRLRADGDMWMEWIQTWEGKVGGYMALSWMRAPEGWACLAPLAVRPEWQNGALLEMYGHTLRVPGGPERERAPWRIGSRMVSMAKTMVEATARHQRNPRALPHTIVVVGKPSFYEHKGFSRARAARLTSPYPLEYTLIARPGDDVPEDVLEYLLAFSAR